MINLYKVIIYFSYLKRSECKIIYVGFYQIVGSPNSSKCQLLVYCLNFLIFLVSSALGFMLMNSNCSYFYIFGFSFLYLIYLIFLRICYQSNFTPQSYYFCDEKKRCDFALLIFCKNLKLRCMSILISIYNRCQFQLVFLLLDSNQMQMHETIADIKMKEQADQIYQVLTRYGYHGIVDRPRIQNNQETIKILADFFEPTPQRQNVIEWLISQLYPVYQSETKNKSKKIMAALWRLGVMPLSKHTKNLDYEKYIAGLLGQQNAINLIYNLCILLKQTSFLAKSKEDTSFNDFLQEILDNFDSLLNVDYDPYKISFPPGYQQLSQQEFESQWQNCQSQLQQLVSRQPATPQNMQYQQIFQQFDRNKQHFKQIYQRFVQKIKSTITNNRHLIFNNIVTQQSTSKVLNISPSLSKKYRNYKLKTALSKLSSSQLSTQRASIEQIIQNINDQVQF